MLSLPVHQEPDYKLVWDGIKKAYIHDGWLDQETKQRLEVMLGFPLICEGQGA